MNRVCIATSARTLQPWQSPSPTCSRNPRNARLIINQCHDNVYYPKQTLSPEDRLCRYCRFLNAINALLRLPSPEYKLASRRDLVFSCDLIFIPKFFGCPTHRWPTLFALPMDHRTTKTFDNNGFFIVGEKQSILLFYFHCPRMCMVPSVLPFALLIANGPFGQHGPWWIIAVLSSVDNVPSWESAIRQVVECQAKLLN